MGSVWSKFIGQDRAVEKLRHFATTNVQSFLFVGPEGCGKEYAARAFASTLITGSDSDSSREADLILRGEFADVNEIFRVGAAVDKEEAESIVTQSSTTPLEAKVKVIIIHEVHLMRDSAAVRLLKTIEEPAPQVVFILLADQLVPSLTTINSRCVVVNFARLRESDIASALIAEGVFPATAESVSKACQGNLDRARLLVTDNYLARRQEAFASIGSRLDGTGAAVFKIVADLSDHLDKAAEALEAMHERELKQLEERVALTGERGSGRKAIADRHKRELRKLRTDELRSGLSIFAGVYSDLLTRDPETENGDEIIAAIAAIHKTISALGLNTKEDLALHALLLKCPPLSTLSGTLQLQ
jgi:DNA polymerase-3 subunit delta'